MKYQLCHQVKLLSMNILLVKKYHLLIKKTIEQDKFTYSPLGKAFEKQTKNIKNQRKSKISVKKRVENK